MHIQLTQLSFTNLFKKQFSAAANGHHIHLPNIVRRRKRASEKTIELLF